MSGGLSIGSSIIVGDNRAHCKMPVQSLYDSHNMQKHMEKYGFVSIKTSRYKIVDIDGPEH